MVTEEPLDLSHLHPAARQFARLPAAERLRHVRADRWIGYTRAARALDKLETLLAWPTPAADAEPAGHRADQQRQVDDHREIPPRSPARLASRPGRDPGTGVQMPSDPSVTRFYTALLAATGAPLRPRQRLAELEQLALRLLRQLHVRMLVIDELHHVLAGRGDGRREFLNLVRFLGNELRIPLVGVGTREAYLAVRSDDQLENRFAPLTLPRWQADEEACSLLASFAASFPLRRPSRIATPEMAGYLLTRSEGTIGELAHLLTDAAVEAIESGEEAITQQVLLMTPYAGPTERRRLFERELT